MPMDQPKALFILIGIVAVSLIAAGFFVGFTAENEAASQQAAAHAHAAAPPS